VTRGRWLDFGVAVGLTVTSQAEIWTAHLRHPIAAAGTTAGVTLALTGRRRWPALVGGLALTVLCLHQLVIGDVEHASAFTVVAIVVATFSLGAHARGRTAFAVGAVGAVGFAVVSAVKGKPIGDFVFVAVVLFAPWLAGLELHRRARRVRQLEAHATDLGQQAERRAHAAVEEERARIARELHDVVAHAMSVIVVQAGAERHVLPAEQESTRVVLETIERTGRQALGEMRRLLGMMRSDDAGLALAPQPSLTYLPDLCQQVRTAGLPVELEVVGPPVPLPPGVDVSAYRIVQEALTNALKHAGPAQARVRVTYRDADLDIEIADDGHGALTTTTPMAGQGLVGMRERVSVYGGELHTGNRDNGGYAVRVRLPLSGTLP
jgi:signal transduction histidine kinase